MGEPTSFDERAARLRWGCFQQAIRNGQHEQYCWATEVAANPQTGHRTTGDCEWNYSLSCLTRYFILAAGRGIKVYSQKIAFGTSQDMACLQMAEGVPFDRPAFRLSRGSSVLSILILHLRTAVVWEGSAPAQTFSRSVPTCSSCTWVPEST